MAGVLILASEILWLILVPLFFPMEDYWGVVPPGFELTFWSMSYMGMSISIHNVGFGIIGGIIAFFILRNDDPKKARNCLYLGIAFMIIGIILNITIASTMPGLDSGFDVNI